MKRNLQKLLLTRVYNGPSTTIFCVTSVTRRLLDTTTRLGPRLVSRTGSAVGISASLKNSPAGFCPMAAKKGSYDRRGFVRGGI